jgi:tetratricopeptide (TPR) repeat protein
MMKWLTLSWRVGSIRGVEIRFHFSVLFSLIITYFIFHPVNLRGGFFALFWLIGFVLCVLLHEVGHALAARFVGLEIKSIVIWLLGGFTNLSHPPEKPLHRFAIFAAGPLATMLLGVLFIVAYLVSYIYIYVYISRHVSVTTFLWLQTLTRLFLSLGSLNIILFVFNMLPIYPLDGGNILHALAELFFGESNANLITLIVSIPVLIGLIAFGIFAHDYILLAFCILIALAVSTLNRHTHRWITLGLNYFAKRGGYYFLQGDYERAAHYYTRDIERQPQQANHYIARSICYLWMLQKEKALADAERALEMAPENPVALVIRCDFYAMDKNYDSALDLLSRAQQLKPDWAPPYVDRGEVLRDKKEYQPAVEEFNKGISLSTKIPLFYVLRSMAHFRLADLEAAHKDQDSALRLSEKDALTRPEFSIQSYEGYLDWAEDYFGRVLLKTPRSWYAYQGRADAYRANSEYDKAIADYTRALEINPREPGLYLGRGRSYQAKGDADRAAMDFRQVQAVTNKLHLRRQAEELLNSLKGEQIENSLAHR